MVANLLGAKAYKRWDTTQAERYTLSAGSGRLIRGLNSPVQIDAYVKTGLPQLDAFVRDLTDLLKEYERAGGGKFKFTIIEPNTDELRAQAKEAGLTETPSARPIRPAKTKLRSPRATWAWCSSTAAKKR